jgi:hypothetical protein
MALANGVVSLGTKAYNTYLINSLMYDMVNYIPNKIRLTVYGIDGYPYLSILENDSSENIIYTTRSTDDAGISNYSTFYGNNIVTRLRNKYNRTLRDYILTDTLGYEVITLFNEPLVSIPLSF